MAILKKSIIIITILVSCMLADVFTVRVDTNNKDVCKKSGLDRANGTQNRDGSCSQTFMGEIPDVSDMISTIIRFPKNNEVLFEKTAFTIKTETINLNTGFFSDPALTYYKFPQTLDKNGKIQGHSHVTIQKLDNGVPDPTVFAFFKGLNEKAKKNILTADVTTGLLAGDYRLCTMTSSFSHQPVLMPVAQRGAQDDCVRFKVIKKKKNGKM